MSVNAYAYCLNNPVKSSDSTGHDSLTDIVTKIILSLFIISDACKVNEDFAYYMAGAIILDSNKLFNNVGSWYSSLKTAFKDFCFSDLYSSIKSLDSDIFYEFYINAKDTGKSELIKDFGIKTVTIKYVDYSFKNTIKKQLSNRWQTLLLDLAGKLTNIATASVTENSIFYKITTKITLYANYYTITTIRFIDKKYLYISESVTDYYEYPPTAVATALTATGIELILFLLDLYSLSKGKVIYG